MWVFVIVHWSTSLIPDELLVLAVVVHNFLYQNNFCELPWQLLLSLFNWFLIENNQFTIEKRTAEFSTHQTSMANCCLTSVTSCGIGNVINYWMLHYKTQTIKSDINIKIIRIYPAYIESWLDSTYILATNDNNKYNQPSYCQHWMGCGPGWYNFCFYVVALNFFLCTFEVMPKILL